MTNNPQLIYINYYKFWYMKSGILFIWHLFFFFFFSFLLFTIIHLYFKCITTTTSITITGFKGNKPATVNIATSLPYALNHLYARFEAHNTAHTAPAAAAEEMSALSIYLTDVTRFFRRVNVRKAEGPDGIPGHVLRASTFQLARVFTDIFNLFFFLSVVPSCFKKIHHCAHTKEKLNHMLE